MTPPPQPPPQAQAQPRPQPQPNNGPAATGARDDTETSTSVAPDLDLGALTSWWNSFDTDPTATSLRHLLDEIKQSWPPALPVNAWYAVAFSALLACGKPDATAPLFKHLLAHARHAQGDDQTPPEQGIARLGDALKDVLMKLFTIIGVVQPIMSVPQLARAELAALACALASHPGEQEEAMILPRLHAFLRRDTQLETSAYVRQDTGPGVDERGDAMMRLFYRHNLPQIMATWGRHEPDFAWLETRVVYGLFLSDTRLLSVVESELVVLAGILALDVRPPAVWHVRGLRRMGVQARDVQTVIETVGKVAAWAGRELRETAGLRAEDVDVEWEP